VIEEPPLLSLSRGVERPEQRIVDGFRNTPTSFIVDAMGGSGALDQRLKPIGLHVPLLGIALTCDCGPADNLALCAAVAQCMPGDVLVAATGGYERTAVVGDLLLGIARNRGAAGFITDGMVRDVADIEALAFPVYAAGVTPNSPARNGPGTVGLPIQCGGLPVSSGDIIAADRDGVVVVPRAMARDVLKELARVREAEAQLLEKVRAGLREVTFVADILSGPRVRRVGG
jgi:4-hydroxy-4-methyl-2-oxoglutarate aldolase